MHAITLYVKTNFNVTRNDLYKYLLHTMRLCVCVLFSALCSHSVTCAVNRTLYYFLFFLYELINQWSQQVEASSKKKRGKNELFSRFIVENFRSYECAGTVDLEETLESRTVHARASVKTIGALSLRARGAGRGAARGKGRLHAR